MRKFTDIETFLWTPISLFFTDSVRKPNMRHCIQHAATYWITVVMQRTWIQFKMAERLKLWNWGAGEYFLYPSRTQIFLNHFQMENMTDKMFNTSERRLCLHCSTAGREEVGKESKRGQLQSRWLLFMSLKTLRKTILCLIFAFLLGKKMHCTLAKYKSCPAAIYNNPLRTNME